MNAGLRRGAGLLFLFGLGLSGCGGNARHVAATGVQSRAAASISDSRPALAPPPITTILQRPSRPGRTPSPPTATVTLTTDSQTTLMAPQSLVSFADGAAGGEHTVIVDETQKYQQIEGFGAAFTDSSAYLLNEIATPTARADAMNNLFTRAGTGIGLTFMRTPMGASDLARYDYSYDDMPTGQTDAALVHFSIAHDQPDIIPIIQQAKQLSPKMKLMASPWSPPGWMKTSGSMIGGSLSPTAYTSFANYFVRYIQAYSAAGVTVDYISLQNEPLNVPTDYPGMSMDAATQTTVLRDYVLPALQNNGLTTKVLIYDHNWDNTAYPTTVLADSVIANSSLVAGSAWHWYAGPSGAMITLQNAYPAVGNYVTEASGGTWISDEVKQDFEMILHSLRSSAKSYVKWGLALDQNRGPHTGGCGTCTPLVTVNTLNGSVAYPIDFYTLGHFSKYILPGATRVYSSNATGIISAAFVNPDGTKVVVAYNEDPAANAFQVQWGTQAFTYTLPSLSGATFTWSGTAVGSYTVAAKTKIQASSFSSVSGLQTESCTDANGGFDVGWIDGGDYAVYKNIDFATGVTGVDLRVASAGNGGSAEFHLDSPTGTLVATATIPITGGWQTWTTSSAVASGATGVHDLYLVFKGTSSVGNINWFQFR